MKVEEFLLKKGQETQSRRKLEEVQSRGNFTPHITAKAKNLKRTGDVFQRYSSIIRLYSSKKEGTIGDQGETELETPSAEHYLDNELVKEQLSFDKQGNPRHHQGMHSSTSRLHEEGSRRMSRQQRRHATEKSESSQGVEFPSQVSTFRQQFYDRNDQWLQKKEEKLRRYRELKDEGQWEGCTFTPSTQPYLREDPIDLLGLEMASDYKIVFSGQTFDLSSAEDLKNFFTKSIEKSGQRSIFRQNYDKLNKIYSNMLN